MAQATLDIERILHRQGFGSRKQCRLMILNGEIRVNGLLCEDPAAEYALTSLSFEVNGEAWDYRANSYLMMHKPAHYECSHKTSHHPTIYSLLPYPLVARGVQCIGRLDEDTTGLILISDDGQFIHRMSSPKHKVPKVYAVGCKHPVSAPQQQQLCHGVQLVDEPEPIAALACEAISDHLLHLTLAEGKYHQVKRMIAAISNRVESLQRIRIGGLDLPPDLPPGAWRWLNQDDMMRLASAPPIA